MHYSFQNSWAQLCVFSWLLFPWLVESVPVATLYEMFYDNVYAITVLLSVCLSSFLLCYALNTFYHRMDIQREVAKYSKIVVKTPPPGAPLMHPTQQRPGGRHFNTANYSQFPLQPNGNMPNMPPQPNMPGMTHNQMMVMNGMRSASPNMTYGTTLEFEGAGVGYIPPQMQQTAGGSPVPQQRLTANGTTDAESDITVADLVDDGILSLPGYLLMDFNTDVRLMGKLAEGGGGVVYKAELTSEEFKKRFGFTDIVVKVIKPLSHMRYQELSNMVKQEIAIMNKLTGHPQIITLVGYSLEPLCINTKMYDRSLFHLVMSQPRYATNTYEYDLLKPYIKDSRLKPGLLVHGFDLIPEIALHLAWGMASGMAEMHRLGILHRDLKSANVLIEGLPVTASGGDRPVWMTDPALKSMVGRISGHLGQSSLAGGVGWGNDAKGKPYCPVNPIICDFGLSMMLKKKDAKGKPPPKMADGIEEASPVGLSYRYAAPEAFSRMYRKKSTETEGKPVDVYAYAVMVWEMLERKLPFGKIPNKEVEMKVLGGERPRFSEEFLQIRTKQDKTPRDKCITILMKMAMACWKQDPRERPSFEQLMQKTGPFWLGPKTHRKTAWDE